MPIGITIADHSRQGFYAGAFLLFFAVVWLRRTTFTFDGQQRIVRWTARRMLKTSSGQIPFDDICDRIVDTMPGQNGITLYRISIVTAQGTVPIEASYSGNRDLHNRVREAILTFVHPGQRVPAVERASLSVLDDSMLSNLLAQGRKVEAIRLLRSAENLSLAAATARVEAMEEERQARN